MNATARCQQCDLPLAGQEMNGQCINCLLNLALNIPTEVVFAQEELCEGLAALQESAGLQIGQYRLLQKIGKGGFGTVWMAEQSEPVQRRVALKILGIGMDTREFIVRFEQERQALAIMDHPNIAKVFDAGATGSGRPFFVMELVDGLPITKFCDGHKLPLKARLGLFLEVCRAIQHAHQKGIIHRDIKPSNILVELDGDVPVPKVIDFGIAKAIHGKLAGETVLTRIEQFIGTPVYMSPEQAAMVPDIDTRSDIYGLGILLYELLTGKPPFDAKLLISAGFDELRRIIREVEPARPSSRVGAVSPEERTALATARQIVPSKITRMIESDLDWIVMKAIDKDRTRRYETVNGFIRDIQRFLASEPVSATPPSAAYKFRKFARRNKALLSMAAVIAAVLVAAAIVSLWHAARASDAWKEAMAKTEDEKAAREDAEAISAFLIDTFHSPDPAIDGHRITVSEVLARAVVRLDADLSGQPARQRQLRLVLGKTYTGLGL
ncbi:MAG: serine/threonine protein kinase [Verrucomicrobiales bacterium]|nr:serine/threonine protein kinase [Verrucomicrobiales bacterium]